MLLAHPIPDLAGLYDRLAPDYDRLHRRWLRHAGGEAQAALEAAVRAIATPGMALLDVGCGTGAFARRLISEGFSPSHMTLLDPSDGMLARCAEIPAQRAKGRLERLPLPSASFDIVTCAWALETVPRLDDAVGELCRVVRPGGVVCLAFCADRPSQGLGGWLLRQSVLRRGAGQFLNEREVIRSLATDHGLSVRSLPCHGPAAALIGTRRQSSSATHDEQSS